MVETALDTLRSLGSSIRAADVIDILIITACLYFAILWLRRRASRAVVVSLSLVALLYLVARQLNMVLTSWMFQVGLTAVLIGLILVFQNDIRSAFERLAALAGIVDRGSTMTRDTAEALARSLADLARRRTGALVVLPGHEPLERYIRGGHELGGQLTEPLIESIFDPSSAGHDGAMIVASDRVLRFGVHLPLSEDLRQLEGHGTRHAAGLGIAERADALVLIVSEEHGTISAAHRGRLEPIEDELALKARIESFARRTGDDGDDPSRNRRLAMLTRWLRPAVLHHWPTKLLSLVVAFLLWLSVAYRVEPIVRQISVPIQFHNLPASMAIRDVSPETITLTLSGPQHRFTLMNMEQLRVSVDLSDVEPGRNVKTFEPDQVNIPAGSVTVSDITPDAVSFTVGPAAARPET